MAQHEGLVEGGEHAEDLRQLSSWPGSPLQADQPLAGDVCAFGELGLDLTAYKDELMARFANTSVKDTLARLAAESSDRIPTWLVPVIRENLEAGRDVTASAAIVASWARYAEGIAEHGEEWPVVDRLRDRVMAAAAKPGASRRLGTPANRMPSDALTTISFQEGAWREFVRLELALAEVNAGPHGMTCATSSSADQDASALWSELDTGCPILG